MSRSDYLQKIMVYLGLLKSGKVEMENTIDRGNLIEILGIHCEKLTLIVKNIFSTGLRILQGTKRLSPIERGQPVSKSIQGKADFENFIVGSETTEFVNKVRNQVRIRQKRMSSIADNCTEHSIIWRMFMATTLNAATFMGEFFNHAKCCEESRKSYIETNV